MALPVAQDDPLLPVLRAAPGAVNVEKLDLNSPLLSALHRAYVNLSLPLVEDGTLIGLLNLSSYPGAQDQPAQHVAPSDAVAAPMVWVLRLVDASRPYSDTDQDKLQISDLARIIEQRLAEQPALELPGWQLTTHFRPARNVGGDFYDFIPFDDGRLGIIVGDVTDKGMPAALIMIITRSVLRAVARDLVSPGPVLAQANDLISADIPTHSFLTCTYALLDLHSGRLRYANAGHTLPYRVHRNFQRQTGRPVTAAVDELKATGMPLGLLPGLEYTEHEALLLPCETLLFHSDGIAEARNAAQEIYGFPRLRAVLERALQLSGAPLLSRVQQDLARFVGDDREPEDDISLVCLERLPHRAAPSPATEPQPCWQNLLEFSLPSQEVNERVAAARVVDAIGQLDLAPASAERLNTAVAEATMNAILHGNQAKPDLPVRITVWLSEGAEYLVVRVTDQAQVPLPDFEMPDLTAKLAGDQATGGWGRFLMRQMVDEVRDVTEDTQHTVELITILDREE
jgi:serine phosphatase RsbU (regulator of sigma subunit)/anti-sigma regulatory factor (Ser/Thr protein kinase)